VLNLLYAAWCGLTDLEEEGDANSIFFHRVYLLSKLRLYFSPSLLEASLAESAADVAFAGSLVECKLFFASLYGTMPGSDTTLDSTNSTTSG